MSTLLEQPVAKEKIQNSFRMLTAKISDEEGVFSNLVLIGSTQPGNTGCIRQPGLVGCDVRDLYVLDENILLVNGHVRQAVQVGPLCEELECIAPCY